jgi:hypothetical protein
MAHPVGVREESGMRIRQLILVLVVVTPLVDAAPPCGTIDVASATVEAGSAPAEGTVTIDPCLTGRSPPALPPLGDIGDIGTMTGSLPAFPGGGTGADDAFTASANETRPGGTYNHTTYHVDLGVTVTYSGPVTINTTGDMTLQGAIVTDSASAPITIRCEGGFTFWSASGGVRTLGASSPIDIMIEDDVSGTATSEISAEDGDVSLSAHADGVAPGGIRLQDASVQSKTGNVTIRSDGRVSTWAATLTADSGAMLIQSFGAHVSFGDDTDLSVPAGPSLTVEAATEVDFGYEDRIRTGPGTLSVTAFGGKVDLEEYVDVTSGAGSQIFRASGKVIVETDCTFVSDSGSIELTAYGGNVEIEPPPGWGGASQLYCYEGDVALRASDSVLVGGRVELWSEDGLVTVRAFGGDFRLAEDARMGGTLDIRAANAVDASNTGGSARFSGTSIDISAGDGGVTVDLDSARAQSGDFDILSAGPVTLGGILQASGEMRFTSLDSSIALQSATVTTTDRIGTPSAGILIDTWGGATASIDAGTATVTSGSSDVASGDVTLAVRTLSEATEAFFLPKRVVVKLNDRRPERSKLIAVGFCDLGPDVVDLTKAAALSVGGETVAVAGLIPSKNGSTYVHEDDGVTFLIKPDRRGSSRAKFKLSMKKDFSGKVDPDADLSMRFAGADLDARGSVTLTKGKYALRRVRGTLLEPDLYLFRAKGKLNGTGKDGLKLLLGLATGSDTPASASEIEVRFGENLEVVIPAADFVKKGDRFEFKGDVQGITRVVLDYAKEMVKIAGKGLDLGAFAEGASAVHVSVRVGSEEKAIRVRMVRKGARLRY